jgi:hypothetical protein
MLKEHLLTVHPQNAKINELCSISSEHGLKQGTLSNHGFTSQEKPALETSYHMALMTEKG